jgi:hypothetical protein
MKKLLIPIGSALLASALTVCGCYLVGMTKSDLYIAAFIAVSVSVTVAVTAALLSQPRS